MNVYTSTWAGCNGGVITGQYICDGSMIYPAVGFQFGEDKEWSLSISPSAFRGPGNGNGNCTAAIISIDLGLDMWIVGQPWFQGKYVDFNRETQKVTVAYLPVEQNDSSGAPGSSTATGKTTATATALGGARTKGSSTAGATTMGSSATGAAMQRSTANDPATGNTAADGSSGIPASSYYWSSTSSVAP